MSERKRERKRAYKPKGETVYIFKSTESWLNQRRRNIDVETEWNADEEKEEMCER